MMVTEVAQAQDGVATESITTTPNRVKVPTVLQQAQVECGAASLGMVLAQLGRWETLETLRHACGVTRDGANAPAIMQAAEQYGLAPDGHRGTVADLNGISVPAIVWIRRSHFIVLEGAHGGTFYVNDPAKGRYQITTEEFIQMYSGAAITFTKTADFTPGGHAYRATPALWRRLRNSKRGIDFTFFAGILAMLLGLVLAPVSQLFINGVLGNERKSLLAALAAILLVIGLFRSGLTLLQYSVIARLQAKMSILGTGSFVERLMRLPLSFYQERSVGDLSRRTGYNSAVSSLLATQLATAGIALIAAIGYAALLIYYSWVIGLIVIILSMLNVLVLKLVMGNRTRIQGRVISQQNKLRGTTTASIKGIETIKSTGREDDVFKTLTGQQAEYISASSSLVPSSALLASIPVLLNALTQASILVLGGWLTISGDLTLGAMLAISALAANLHSPIQNLMNTGSQLQVITASLQALDDVLENPVDGRFARRVMDPNEALPDYSGHILLDGISFSYGEKAPLVIENLTLELTPGKRVALVGGSGSGKTTIANLAAGLYLPNSGHVLYDGKPLTDYPIGVLERYISKVDQSIVLFEGTVRDNVTLWDPTIPTDQIERALADAQVLTDVLARDQGIDCFVSENGRNFSGGQCQRIEIARALVLDPRVIVLDEATSALDDITEKRLDEALRRRGVSCIIVAHRLSTIRDADEIIVLGSGGKLLERGTHDELLAAGGAYHQMITEAGEGGDVGS